MSAKFENLKRKAIALGLTASIGGLGLTGCSIFEDPLRSTEPATIATLPPLDRYIHDYLGDKAIGDDCLRNTDYALFAEVNGKPVPVGSFDVEKDKQGNPTVYTVTPGDNPNLSYPPRTTILRLYPESTGQLPLQPVDSKSTAILKEYQCSLTYDQ